MPCYRYTGMKAMRKVLGPSVFYQYGQKVSFCESQQGGNRDDDKGGPPQGAARQGFDSVPRGGRETGAVSNPPA
jgi:hypothetical protein